MLCARKKEKKYFKKKLKIKKRKNGW